MFQFLIITSALASMYLSTFLTPREVLFVRSKC